MGYHGRILLEDVIGAPMKRTLGIVLDYPPEVLTNAHGLSRLLMFLIKGCSDSGNKVVILCPEWCRIDLSRLFIEFNIPERKDYITIQSTGSHFPVLSLYYWFTQWREKPKHPSILRQFNVALKERVARSIAKIGSSTSWVTIFLITLLCILLIPVIALVFLGYLMFKLILVFSDGSQTSKGTTFANKIFSNIGEPLHTYRKNQIFLNIFRMMNRHECRQLARLANEQKDIGAWLIPTPFWPELVQQIHNSVVVCPDTVITDFPVGFVLEDIYDLTIDRKIIIGQSFRAAKKIITYSNYVKYFQVVERFGISEAHIEVIPHGHISLVESLKILKPFDTLNSDEKRDLCLQILHNYTRAHVSNTYLKTFNFSGTKFLVFTSQGRPHKNLSLLIRAFHRLLWERHEPIKLVLTVDTHDQPDIQKLIEKLGITRDVVILSNLPNQIMAALNHLSALAVNPTLFEGGFPFTFSEAYSVGTPSVMSRIPVVEEVITDQKLQKVMLFDPYNIDDMVEHIYWGLHHRDELFDLQKHFYSHLKERSWAQVAQEYKNVLDQIGV